MVDRDQHHQKLTRVPEELAWQLLYIVVIPIPESKELGTKGMFVLPLLGKLMPFYPTLTGCCQFHYIQEVVPWTPLTSNPSDAFVGRVEDQEVWGLVDRSGPLYAEGEWSAATK